MPGDGSNGSIQELTDAMKERLETVLEPYRESHIPKAIALGAKYLIEALEKSEAAYDIECVEGGPSMLANSTKNQGNTLEEKAKSIGAVLDITFPAVNIEWFEVIRDTAIVELRS